MDSVQPPQTPIQPVDYREIRKRILIFGIVASAILLAGYGYAKYISYQNYKETSAQAQKAQQDIEALRQRRATEGQFCGGIATGAFPCPTGYSCKLDGDFPDAGGHCVKN